MNDGGRTRGIRAWPGMVLLLGVGGVATGCDSASGPGASGPVATVPSSSAPPPPAAAPPPTAPPPATPPVTNEGTGDAGATPMPGGAEGGTATGGTGSSFFVPAGMIGASEVPTFPASAMNLPPPEPPFSCMRGQPLSDVNPTIPPGQSAVGSFELPGGTLARFRLKAAGPCKVMVCSDASFQELVAGGKPDQLRNPVAAAVECPAGGGEWRCGLPPGVARIVIQNPNRDPLPVKIEILFDNNFQ